jgi:hypothetical protein
LNSNDVSAAEEAIEAAKKQASQSQADRRQTSHFTSVETTLSLRYDACMDADTAATHATEAVVNLKQIAGRLLTSHTWKKQLCLSVFAVV